MHLHVPNIKRFKQMILLCFEAVWELETVPDKNTIFLPEPIADTDLGQKRIVKKWRK